MKTKTFLIAAVLLLTFSAAAFAQATYSVGSIPVTAVANNGQTEKTGSITLTPITGSGVIQAGTFTISYGVPITVAAASISINGALNPACGAAVYCINTVNNAAGQLVVTVGAAVPAGTALLISGVRVATAGSTLTSLNANISATGNAIVAGQTSVTVVYSVTPPIASLTVALPGAAAINAVVGSPAPGTTVNMVVREGFLTAFGVTAVTDPTQTLAPGGNQLKFTVDAPPAGIQLTFPAATVATSGTWILTDSAGAPLASQVLTSTSTSFDVYYTLTADTSLVNVDTVTIPVTLQNTITATFPITAAAIKASVTMAPIGTAFSAFGLVLPGPIPRYAAAPVGPTTLFNINPGTTTLLIPFASTLSGYDTGIAIVNTTNDPGIASTGLASAAVAQSGGIKFFFYPASGTPFNYTTSASSPGTGLTSGALAAGRTYSVLLSELLNAAGAPKDFAGHIFAVANFTNAHTQYFVTNFTAFTNGALGLVMGAGGRAATPETLGQ
jgi:hypothetical protein